VDNEHGRCDFIMTFALEGRYDLSTTSKSSVGSMGFLAVASRVLFPLFVEIHNRLLQRGIKYISHPTSRRRIVPISHQCDHLCFLIEFAMSYSTDTVVK
jgi:hypothetical protein